MNCRKHGIEVTGCSKNPCFPLLDDCKGCDRLPLATSFVVAPRGEDLPDTRSLKKVKAVCSICKQPIRDNVDPEKVITCGRCVQRLLTASRENKIALRNSLLEKGDSEGARSVESFIVPDEDDTIATFKTSCSKRGSKGVLPMVKGYLNRRCSATTGNRRTDGKV